MLCRGVGTTLKGVTFYSSIDTGRASHLYGRVCVNILGLRFYIKIMFGICELQLKKNSIFVA